MNQTRTFRLLTIFCLLLGPALSSAAGQSDKLVISTEDQTAEEFVNVPCDDTDRVNAVKALFGKMGAKAEDVIIEKRNDVENVVIRKPGLGPGIIIIGAHYDKTKEGCGAVDNWTGIATIAHIYRSLRDVQLHKTLIFVAFGKEEKGLYGSKAMVGAIKKEELAQYCAMVNVDSLGMATPQVLENLSSKPLVIRVEELAKRMGVPFSRITIPGVGADSVPFVEKNIPAVTISGLGKGWSQVLHTKNDQVASVNSTSVYLGYRLTLALVAELDELPCEASRKEAK